MTTNINNKKAGDSKEKCTCPKLTQEPEPVENNYNVIDDTHERGR